MERLVKVTIRIPDTLHERIVQLSRRDRRSLNSEIIVLLEDAADHAEPQRRDQPE
jgi:predicted HicB family RNase H-like nuclease